MFETKEAINAAVTTLTEQTADLKRGDILKWEEIEETTGIKRYTEHWSSMVKRWRRDLLRTRGIACWPEVTVGLRLLTNEEQVTVIGRKRTRKMFRQSSMAMREISAADSSQLSLQLKRLKIATLDNAKIVRRQLRRTARELKGGIRKTDVNPKRTVVKTS